VKMQKVELGKDQVSKVGYVRVKTNLSDDHVGPVVGRMASVTIGDMLIPVTSAIIRIKPDDFITVELETQAEYIDIEALEKQTKLTIKREDK